jgi:ankyrin repeat protein
LACNFGNFEVVKYLVAHGAKILIKDRFGNTPLDEAKLNNYPEIVDYLNKILEEDSASENSEYEDKCEQGRMRFKSNVDILPIID